MSFSIRILLIASCVAAGVVIAVALAAQYARPEPVGVADRRENAGIPDQITAKDPDALPVRTSDPSDHADAPAAENKLERPAPASDDAVAADAVATEPPAAYYMHHPPAAIAQLDRIGAMLDRVADVSTQNQIKRLEQQVASLASSATPYVHPRAEAGSGRTGSGPARIAAVVAGDAGGEPTLNDAAIRRGEGDDQLTLNLRGQDLRELLEFLSAEAGLNILASDNVKGKVTASLSNMDAESAILAILRISGFVAQRDGKFLYVGTVADMQRMQQLNDQVDTRVYRTQYVTAAELQALITPLLSENGKLTVSSPAETSIPSDTVQTGGDDFAGNEVVMVQDYKTVLRRIDDIVKKIDERPRQVMIEAMIVSVALDDSHSVGINFETFQKSKKLRLVSGTPMSSLGEISLTKGGLQFGVLDGNVAAFIDALEGIGDTNVIAAPHLLCLNKQRAEILIGDQKGYLSTTQTETATTQTVEFLDIGTQLRIRPFISADGMVRLEVHPELSTGDVKLIGQFALPEKTTTQVTTNIMCRDGCTVVIGGLIREDHARTVTQAALIGNVPLLGPLFRNKKVEDQRSEIIVMLTPRIVHDPAFCEPGDECLGQVSHRRAALESRRISPVARRHYSDRYYRLAQSAWYAGNVAEAQRYVEISLQMKPRSIKARRLYSVIVSGEGHHPLLLHEGPAPHPTEILDPAETSQPGPELLPPVEPSSRLIPRQFEPPTPDQVRAAPPRTALPQFGNLRRLEPVTVDPAVRPASAELPIRDHAIPARIFPHWETDDSPPSTFRRETHP